MPGPIFRHTMVFSDPQSGGGSGSVTSVAGGAGLTGTPEPIVGAGTLDLDINSLTTETVLASGDLFPFVDVSVGTTPASQRKVTLANLAAAIGTGGTVTSVAGGTGITNTPEPIVGAGTVDLDLNSLTTETTSASGDLFGMVDVSVGTTIAAQRKITRANILGTELEGLRGLGTSGLTTRTGAGTYTGRTLTGPAAGITVSNGDGVAGNPTLALADDLAGIEALASTGYVSRTASNTYAVRTFSASTGIQITNGDGVAGNSVISPINDLGALEGLSGTGVACRVGAETWALRTLTAPAAGFTITDPTGAGGNPTFVLANDLAALEGLGSTGIACRTGADTWAQRTVTGGTGVTITNPGGVAGNIDVALNLGAIDHNSLTNLAVGDVHTHYLLLAGRTGTTNNPVLSTSGDGTITGSSASGGDLYALSTSHATKGALRWNDPQVWWESIPAFSGTDTKRVAQFNPSITMSPGGIDIHTLIGVAFDPTVTADANWYSEIQGVGFHPAFSVGANAIIGAVRANCTVTNTKAPGNFGSFLLFNANPTLSSATAAIAPYACYTVVSQPIVSFDGTGTATAAPPVAYTGASSSIGLFDTPLLRNTSTGTFNIDHTALESIPRITESAGTLTVSALRGVRVRPPTISGSPTITLHVGLDIEDIGIGSTTTANSLRSTGTSVTMRHAGHAIYGSTGAPNVVMDIDGDLATRAANLALSNGNNDNIAIGARSFIRVTGPTAGFAIRGIASGFNGKRVVIYNTTTQNMSINNEDAGSTAANRIRTNTGATVTTTGEGSVEVIYDATQSRWILISTSV